jgi:hypothetical protein
MPAPSRPVTVVRLALTLGVAALTILSITSKRVDTPILLLVVGGTAASIVGLVNGVVSRRRLKAAAERIRAAVPSVVAGSIEPPPPDITSEIDTVRRLGFNLVGATDTRTNGRSIRTWILTEPSGRVWVEVGQALVPMAIFLSDAAAGRFIETAYPIGEPIDDPDLFSQVVGSHEEEALTVHRAAVRDAGGVTRRVVTMDDYLAAEADHRSRTGGMRLRAYVDRVVRPSIRDWSIGLVVDLVALLALLVAIRNGA